MRILKKCGIKYEEQAVRTLLLWCKRNELPATAKTAFDIETWEEAGKKLFEAASKGDQVATQTLTIWRLVKDSLAQLRADKKAKAAAASATDPEPSPRPASPSTFPVPMAPQLPPTEGAQQTVGESVNAASVPLPDSRHSSSPEPPLIDLSDTGCTGTEHTRCINRAGAPESSVVTDLFSVSPVRVTIAGPHPAKFLKHLCQQAWDDGDVETAKAMRGETAAYSVYRADGAAAEWEQWWAVIKELRSTCM